MADAAARVKELEKNVNDLEKLMALKKSGGDKKASAAASVPVEASAKAVVPPPHKPTVKPAPRPEPTLVDTLMDNITYIGVALAALLAGAGLIVARRRKQQQLVLPRAETSILGDPGTQAHSLFAETGGQSVDTNNSVFNSNFAASASQLDTNEVDPVAEADVYIAYGRDAQAEEILKEALRTHPERHPVRLKLLEIYATRKDARSFEAKASELYAMTKGQGDEWAQASAMGLSIDPLNPLYTGSAAHDAGASLAADATVGAGLTGAAALGAAAFAAEEYATHAPDFGGTADAAPSPSAAGLDLDLSQDAAPAADKGMDFALDEHVDHDMATALPTLSAPTPAAMADAADAEHFLDFDLGGLSVEPTPAPAAAPQAPLEEPSFDMAFDAPAAIEPLAVAPESVAPAPVEHDFSMDFGLDLPAEPEAAPTPAPVIDDLSLDHNFDLPELQAAKPTAVDAVAPEFDLSGIDLDLNTRSSPSAAPARDDAMSALHMEMDTKLDLAIAYQEIGDKEGARELLDEVLRGGSDEQVAKANAMRAQLA